MDDNTIQRIAAAVAAHFRMDFDLLKQQLQANTELVEGIKTEISQRDWAKREWTNLRRQKLELLIEKIHECDAFVERLFYKAEAGQPISVEGNPFYPLTTLQELYFPELGTEVGAYLALHRQAIIDGAQHARNIAETLDAPAGARDAARQRLYEIVKSYHAARLAAVADVTTAARKLLRSIMGG